MKKMLTVDMKFELENKIKSKSSKVAVEFTKSL